MLLIGVQTYDMMGTSKNLVTRSKQDTRQSLKLFISTNLKWCRPSKDQTYKAQQQDRQQRKSDIVAAGELFAVIQNR